MSEDAEKENGLGGYFINLTNPWTIIATVITLVAAITAPMTIALTSYIGGLESGIDSIGKDVREMRGEIGDTSISISAVQAQISGIHSSMERMEIDIRLVDQNIDSLRTESKEDMGEIAKSVNELAENTSYIAGKMSGGENSP